MSLLPMCSPQLSSDKAAPHQSFSWAREALSTLSWAAGSHWPVDAELGESGHLGGILLRLDEVHEICRSCALSDGFQRCRSETEDI